MLNPSHRGLWKSSGSDFPYREFKNLVEWRHTAPHENLYVFMREQRSDHVVV